MNRQAFIDWLATQPPDRQFSQSDGRACPLACYMREAGGMPEAFVGRVRLYKRVSDSLPETLPLPGWAMRFVQEFDFGSFARTVREARIIMDSQNA